MKLLFASLALCLRLTAQTVTPDPLTPQIPSSLSVFADKGDLTYCVTTAVKGTKPLVQVTCRRSGVTHLTTTYIDSTTFVNNGDQSWLFMFNAPQQVKFQAVVNQRDLTGVSISMQQVGLNGQFQIGDSVSNTSGASGKVVHWYSSTGTLYNDGGTYTSFAAMLVLTNVTGTFTDGERISGTQGTNGAIQHAYTGLPPLNPVIKSSGTITWPTTASLWHRLFSRK